MFAVSYLFKTILLKYVEAECLKKTHYLQNNLYKMLVPLLFEFSKNYYFSNFNCENTCNLPYYPTFQQIILQQSLTTNFRIKTFFFLFTFAAGEHCNILLKSDVWVDWDTNIWPFNSLRSCWAGRLKIR